ncbi:MAG TPA: DUF3052 domain-containing protein [Gemmatimonadales bacterium]|nr:DUF3052 domain-containing protein [Gemmatimonadales bacterium]
MPAGYSKQSLVQKLGIKEGTRIALVSAPRGYRKTLGPLPAGVRVTTSARGALPFIQFFAVARRDLAKRFPALVRSLAPHGGLWISWPKQTSGKATDLKEDLIRELGLACGVVDVKVCAVDEIWSGLKFMRRVTPSDKER